ncbi:phenylalanine--tRNA ligase subunit alpha [Candidatus Nucleicultrix amoebiphila]|jgi:phenylalanyl-tRNA synthetase alpha chain|uniref:Phenylalanine--tRNA ligase alpha subunit n=1 Tax=Candidatus Nucleicultrix amoebiphila FS5 TaxID=1414854 RepID=A0A1W6N5U0_9PROT|nr:phenylalanine--tRNA ligase subunit alpha [Candidatus Nucleicultrix amoebiphila]ARN85250.1 phenylalanyl-tRNA synthetase subunit alpha [Candidatus Nucleicultrix amoebiphila FS5]
MEDLVTLKASILQKISEANNLKALEDLRVQTLGKQGSITVLMKNLGSLEGEARKEQGQKLNDVRASVGEALDKQLAYLEAEALSHQLISEKIDITLPGRSLPQGTIHALSEAMFEAISIFKDMGFWIAEGPEIEDDEHNFTALNIPETHPARQEQDTFYLPKDEKGTIQLLRTHTSPVQIRTMREKKPPLRIIAPGRVYRSDFDQTHTPTFHQIEGFYVDEGVHMGHLKGCLTEFCRRFFGKPKLPVRFRPSFFPFTEPSAEVDIGCRRGKDGLEIGEGSDWLEILGCGMVHPKVLKNCGIDPQKYQGFAFGMGIERIAMLKFGIPDLRSFYEPDLRWLSYYGFDAAKALREGRGL